VHDTSKPDTSYTQDDHLLSIDTPLGKDALLLQELSGREGISRLFSYELDLLAYNNDSISFADIVGQNVTITIQLPDGSPRYINGYVSRFTQGPTDERLFTKYHAQVVPWLWFLTRQADCRIFQNMKPLDIISQVLDLSSVNDYRPSLQGNYPTLDYCVQYRETSFNFVSRLMEEYGIFYYFDHSTEGQHTMVLADQSSALPDCPGSPISYETQVGGLNDPQVVSDWRVQQELRTGKYTVTDYNFTTPSTSLLANEQTVVELSASQDLELFDYPGIHTTKDEGDAVAKLRMQEEEAGHLITTGSSNFRALMSGYSFELQNHYRDDQNTTYVVTDVQHFASVGSGYTAGTDDPESYSNQFTCIPASVAYRPPRLTPKPFVQGPQTALVVGKDGEEIWVDNYGRVIVQFYWDRQGQKNENSSCWIRTSQPWAGDGWGAIWIPRIGQEVIVSFLEGDPDRPIITGRVYNADQMPPYDLPDNQTRSTFMSRSSQGGGSSNYNEIRFEDKMGSEQIFINAEKDMDLRVENDSREYVGNDRSLIVHADQKEKIEGDLHIQVTGNRNEHVGQTLSLQVDQSLYEKSMSYAHEATEEIHLKAANVVIEAEMELTIKASGGFVNIGPSGVTISGTPMVLINSGGAAGSGSGSNPTDPDDPDTADDGSQGGKLS
jgi:type VI secretion system secreted protein VgrG